MSPGVRARSSAAVLCALAAAFAHPGCTRAPAQAPEAPLTVFAASSLQDVARALSLGFEQRHPGARVRFNFAGSQELATQLEHGAGADVFLSADEAHALELAQAGLSLTPSVFICNALVIAVPAANPAGLKALKDLPKAERIVLAAPQVPAGAYAEEVLSRASAQYGATFGDEVHAHVVSRELNVRQALAKVALGEADAALVYRTDARAAGERVLSLELPPDLGVVARVAAVRLKASAHPLADAFVRELQSDAAQALLRDQGFIPCPSQEAP